MAPVFHHRSRRALATRGRGISALALLSIPLVSGCYSMRPVELSEVSPGDEVVVHLDVEASRRMSAEEGYDLRTLSGRLEPSDGSAVVLSTQLGRRVQGVMMDDTRRLFTLDQPDVILLERREFNRNRSALVGAALVGGIIWSVLQISGDGGSGPDGEGEPPPPAPSIRIRLPLPR